MSVGYLDQGGDAQRIQNEMVQQGNSKKSSGKGHCVRTLKNHVGDQSTDGGQFWEYTVPVQRRSNQLTVFVFLMAFLPETNFTLRYS